MKESVYGWYPSTKDVYRNAPRFHNNLYHLECLYKFQNSQYYTGQVPPPQSTISIGLKNPPSPDRRWVPSTSKRAKKFGREKEQVDLEQGSPCLMIKPAPRVKPTPIPTLSEAWATPAPTAPSEPAPQLSDTWLKPTTVEATPITVAPAVSYPKSARYKSFQGQSTMWSPQYQVPRPYTETPRAFDPSRTGIDWPAMSRPKTPQTKRVGFKGCRIKSAPPRKIDVPKFSTMSRPVQSAKPTYRPRPPSSELEHQERPKTCPALHAKSLSETAKRETQSMSALDSQEGVHISSSRPQNPTPNLADLSLEDNNDLGLVSDDETSSKDDYEEAIEKYGWRAEVHGDPYGLKKPRQRLSYTITCDEPVIPPEPPSGHMENWQTFFLNTIPSRPMTYTVHKEWISEVIHAKRMELQKKQGVNYNFKKYAFAY